jgi:ribosomal protein S27AE
MAHNSWMGFRTLWGQINANSCKAMNCTHTAFRGSMQGSLIAQGSVAENSRYSFDCGAGSIVYTIKTRFIEGRCRMTESVNSEDTSGAPFHQHSPTWYTHPAGGDGTNTWVARNAINVASGSQYPTI